MTSNILLPILAMATFGLVILFAIVSKARTQERKHDPSDPGSSLARDTADPNFQPDEHLTRKDLHPDAETPVVDGPAKSRVRVYGEDTAEVIVPVTPGAPVTAIPRDAAPGPRASASTAVSETAQDPAPRAPR